MMNTPSSPPSPPPVAPASDPARRRRTITKTVLALILLGLGIAGAAYFQKTAPKARKRPPVAMVPLVEVQTLARQPHQVTVSAMGSVVAARQIELKASVAGEVIATHNDFIEGGLLKKGAKIVRIDPRDYELALAQKKRALADARYEVQVEQGHQAVARREWELLGDGDPKGNPSADLALRKPHLERARERLKAAEADLEQTRLDLKRTVVTAPFNAVVLAKHVDVGTRINTNEPLALLVDSDRFWVRIALPLDQLKWIRLPTADDPTGAEARIIYRDQYSRFARVTKLLSDLGDAGQMARLIATVEDPLGITKGAPAMLIGEVVQVALPGGRIENAFAIARSALRDQDRLWLVSDDGRLEIRPVTIAWRGEATVLVTEGLEDGEHLVVSDLAAPVNGMKVQVEPKLNTAQKTPKTAAAPAGPASPATAATTKK